ncbi:hypothetical protein [Arthrobacter rhombi]|uniref:hypothetical protein n=1 Tax=Arthrobacter rhombi TaxID=71253 RepID=UPI003FD2491B
MPALLQHSTHTPTDPRGAPRFSGDWVDAVVVLGNETVSIDTHERGYLLISDDFTSLSQALGPPRAVVAADRGGTRRRSGVQFNEQLNMLLVPGGHERAGRSFFPLHPAPSPTWP